MYGFILNIFSLPYILNHYTKCLFSVEHTIFNWSLVWWWCVFVISFVRAILSKFIAIDGFDDLKSDHKIVYFWNSFLCVIRWQNAINLLFWRFHRRKKGAESCSEWSEWIDFVIICAEIWWMARNGSCFLTKFEAILRIFL